MSYRFGINKKFKGTHEEWVNLKKTKVIYIDVKNGGVTVKCPHCGSKNEHSTKEGHRSCDCWPGLRKNTMYDCPGYTLKCGFNI